MELIDSHLISLVIFSPLAGLIPLGLVPNGHERGLKTASLVLSFVPFLFSLVLFARFQGSGAFEFQEIVPWFTGFAVDYRVGVDGFSLPLILLTTFLQPIVLASAWREIRSGVRGFLFCFTLLQTGMLGVFAALDLFLFYVFWEVTLVPMYFLIGIWGGPRRVYAAIKFVLYTMVGSLLMLAAILYLYFAAGRSFNITDLYGLAIPWKAQILLFAAFSLAFAIKVPLFPFHTWLPDAHVEAPTSGSVILAGVLLKMGTYGFVRFAMPLFPQAVQAALPLFLILSVIGIVYGALVSMVQPDLKKLVAFSSVSHLGFVILGLFSLNPQGVSGATLQMVNHGLSTGALFLLVGMIYERRHTRQIADFGGIASIVPIFTLLFLVVGFSSIALPGTNGFVGEFLILIGAFKAKKLAAVVAGLAVIIAALYMLWMVRRVFFGPVTHEENRGLKDLTAREILVILPIVVMIFWIGIAPGFLLDRMDRTVDKFLNQVAPHGISHTP